MGNALIPLLLQAGYQSCRDLKILIRIYGTIHKETV